MTAMEQYVKALGGSKPIRKILIANNGMAATKAMLSMRQWAFMELGSTKELKFIAMASKDDLEANAEFIRLADSFVEVPAGKNVNNYANVDLICEIAQKEQVDAVWPGWGHASEKPELPRTLAAAGITFLGPTAPVMHALGDKIASTILAQTAEVPCIPWNGEGITSNVGEDGELPQDVFEKACLHSYEEAEACAKRIGFPVVLKASEGGGGKGIRLISKHEDLLPAWEQVRMEVVGSPIFMMQLCTKSRHLEVQLVGDAHGQVVALNGRDCSTQRRFQKIFEEGPPTIAKPEIFRKMEQAAMNLARNVKYRGAGTVEYLYSASDHKFYFLELNPRLQVEHPVTESITGVNVPALQLLVGMGVPLHRAPDVRRFYGLDPMGDSAIDFQNTMYKPISSHCIASRITAENPDDEFRPTSGLIGKLRYQSSPNAWGYFSSGFEGKIHEFADSQFGHVFAKGKNREEARKQMQLALQNISNQDAEICTPVAYLVELADTDAFKNNTIDTAWLDGLIAAKALRQRQDGLDAVFYAACFRAHNHVKSRAAELLEGIKKGHLPLHHDLKLLQTFIVEVAYDSTKYVWDVSRVRENEFALTIGGTTLKAHIREQRDGSLYVSTGDRIMRIHGTEEALGLKLHIKGTASVTIPILRDPSELRSDFAGKLVRYLHPNGADIEKGEAFAELEAMKMIMSLRATESGKISQVCAPGAIIAAGQLLGNLELKDLSNVQLVKAFTGTFEMSKPQSSVSEEDALAISKPISRQYSEGTTVMQLSKGEVVDEIAAYLQGFRAPKGDASVTKLVQRLFAFEDEENLGTDHCLSSCEKLLKAFLNNEQFFAGLVGGDETQIIAKYTGTPEELLSLIFAHDFVKDAQALIATLLRSLISSASMDATTLGPLPTGLVESLMAVSKLPQAGGYGEVSLLASQALELADVRSFSERRDEVRDLLKATKQSAIASVVSREFHAGETAVALQMLSTLFVDCDSATAGKISEAFARRMYRGFEISDFEFMQESNTSVLTYCYPGSQAARKACFFLVPNADALKSAAMPEVGITEAFFVFSKAVPEMKDPKMFADALSTVSAAVSTNMGKIGAQCETACAILCRDGSTPTYMHYSKAQDWKEVPEYRGLRVVYPLLLELEPLRAANKVELVQEKLHTSTFLITPPGGAASNLACRTVAYDNLTLDNFEECLKMKFKAIFDKVEMTLLDPKIEKMKPVVRGYLHVVKPIPGCTERDALFLRQLFDRVVEDMVTTNSDLLLKLSVGKLEVKVWAGAGEKAIPLHLVASSASQWKATALLGSIDAKSGLSASWTDVETGEVRTDKTTISSEEAKLHAKRTQASMAGSTYIYDFLGLFRSAILQTWQKQGDKQVYETVKDKVFVAKELVYEGGKMVEIDRPPARNSNGMLAWLCTLRTPEYPEGREMILIGNDVTIKAGSFSMLEDDVYQKASEMARARGIPRVYIACNSGARLGAVEELKKHLQVAWVDDKDASKGFEYLYIADDAMKALPEGAVISHTVKGPKGENRHVLDTVVGSGLPSIAAGIGVENLRGSGMIAGETSRAYQETFTLSFVTGRSVGIGAYLNRLGQRVIQKVKGPMVLTGFHALNKLLGKQVYTTQDQLGGPHIMWPIGVTHELVDTDRQGVEHVLRWLSYIPRNTCSLAPIVRSLDPIERPVAWCPKQGTLYDPRYLLTGARCEESGEFLHGLCDEGSFVEYLDGWGKTVVVGRGRLGGLPIGVIAVETRNVTRHVPADPANMESHDIKEPQAGQVLFPDSSYKLATAIRDFNRGENLPLVILANWRGFSGGTRDMYAEVLKYGSMIVDAFVEYKHPICIYIPPYGELRGGAWVVFDPKINEEQMEMYADEDSRGGILEPEAAVEIIFKANKEVITLMRTRDEELKGLVAKAEACQDKAQKAEIEKAIAKREKALLPFYRQAAVHYCDLHDRAGRMQAVGCIRSALQWKTARSYIHWRLRRRLQENSIIKTLQSQCQDMTRDQASEFVSGLLAKASVQGDKECAEWMEGHKDEVAAAIEERKMKALEEQIFSLVQQLPVERQGDLARDLSGYIRVAAARSGYPAK
eukprot:TRINITY_DN74365_c0_g1_i1.p1 TRINITY_DN74365_c0_g1~~TRINITY_DN74365_c0_g1_i1.p1  ORF type:complete len:2071 (+),score=634.24 TRINITY_DN74365_c0_g1_i1:56-6268(+)